MPKQALKLKIIGRVQGVFYRNAAQQTARNFGLTGWISNASDGSVECWVEAVPTNWNIFYNGAAKGQPTPKSLMFKLNK